MKKTFLFIALAVFGLTMTACGSKEGDKNVKVEITKDSSMEIDAQAYAQLLDQALKSDKNLESIENEIKKADDMIMSKYEGEKLMKLGEMVEQEVIKLGYKSMQDLQQKFYEKYSNQSHEGLADDNYDMGDMDMSDIDIDAAINEIENMDIDF